MYQIDNEKLNKRPEIRLGDKIYSIDNRLSTFRGINGMLKALEGGETASSDEFEIVIGQALGLDSYQEILGMDLPFAVMQDLVVIVLAAIQDLNVEEAKRRFRGKTE
ncbi:MAG: hypothetical protein FWE33_01725 [Defluviitaleaceae bacterium]|nr:hypothetical protein [Defluviitaleaceae bacterium]